MIGCVYHTVVECYHNRGRFENRTGFQQVADCVVFPFAIGSVFTLFHVYDGLDITGTDFHHDSYAHIATDFLQLVYNGTFGQILHTYVNGRYDVGTIYRGSVCDIQEFVEYLTSMDNAVFTPQNAVIG